MTRSASSPLGDAGEAAQVAEQHGRVERGPAEAHRRPRPGRSARRRRSGGTKRANALAHAPALAQVGGVGDRERAEDARRAAQSAVAATGRTVPALNASWIATAARDEHHDRNGQPAQALQADGGERRREARRRDEQRMPSQPAGSRSGKSSSTVAIAFACTSAPGMAPSIDVGVDVLQQRVGRADDDDAVPEALGRDLAARARRRTSSS